MDFESNSHVQQDELKLLGGAMITLALATSALVVVPFLQLKGVEAPAALKPYTAAQLLGREQYISNACIYCHSQQPRDNSQAPDDQRGWGRASVAADYTYDKPHLLGTMRTGPDLFNIWAICTSRVRTRPVRSSPRIRSCSRSGLRPNRETESCSCHRVTGRSA